MVYSSPQKGFPVKIIILFILLLLCGPSLFAGDPFEEEILVKTGIGLYQGIVPLVNLELKGEHLGVKGGIIHLPLTLGGEKGEATLYQMLLKMYSPISYYGTEFYLGLGLAKPFFQYQGVNIETSNWYQVLAGIERPLSERWSIGGSLRYIYSPTEVMGIEGGLVLGLNLSYRQIMIWTPTKPYEASDYAQEDEEIRDGETPLLVSASGSITGTSLPVSISGTWTLEADLVRGSGRISVSGSSGYGSFSYSGSGSAQYTGSGVVVTLSESFTSQGYSATGRATFTASSSGMRVRVSASRADGISASASITGTTSSFQAIWE